MQKSKIALAIASVTLASGMAHATNGMNMEGYGPISTAMGGTAQAYNNGLGGMMNNPATMGHGSIEGNKFQLALGSLNPTITSSHDQSGAATDSTGGPYIMPGAGYAQKRNGFVWGVGVMGQGGMGTEYGKAGATDLFAGGLSSGGYDSSSGPLADGSTPNNPKAQTLLSGKEVRSEVSVGRVVIPVGYEVTDKLNIAASLDYVWAGMDMLMDMDGASFSKLMQGQGGSVGGTMAQGLGTATQPSSSANNGMVAIRDVNYARFEFSDNSDFTGQAKGSGFAGKVGFTYDVSPQLTIGGSFHNKTAISDLEGDASLVMNVDADGGLLQQSNPTGYTDMTMTVTGKIKVVDFQWPTTFGIGASYRATDTLTINADFKRISWSDSMKSLKMAFVADGSATNGNFANTALNVSMDQNWDDQNVIMVGAQWKAQKNLALRVGANMSNNPVPKETLNPLFPAIIENHYTAGVGYGIGQNHVVDASIVMAPEVKQTSAAGVTSSHSQMNWQMMYTYKWNVQRKSGF